MAEFFYKISVPDHLIDRLHQKLELATLPDELEGAGWDYGVPLADVKRLVARRSSGYDWRHHEEQLNATLPQFTRPVDVDGPDLGVHLWFSRDGPAASLRIYFEAMSSVAEVLNSDSIPTIPLGVSLFPKDAMVFPKSWPQTMGNIVFEREHEGGGHFAAYEKPNELVDDLRQMFGRGGPAFGVVSGRTGYDVGGRSKL
ncbi:hypothetical protein MSAN_01340100 [Mycena sanguinolenta]|uniref:Epoxide hydrolase N-terminal domain-containing protein n=1 Tax=Mycena sanguinolenta TaxID=230812 RepID=A0A8H6YFQ3_9AGAR|nr:hypothetical protein MSAN_01340100 [Mycena sanguinolenta]